MLMPTDNTSKQLINPILSVKSRLEGPRSSMFSGRKDPNLPAVRRASTKRLSFNLNALGETDNLPKVFDSQSRRQSIANTFRKPQASSGTDLNRNSKSQHSLNYILTSQEKMLKRYLRNEEKYSKVLKAFNSEINNIRDNCRFINVDNGQTTRAYLQYQDQVQVEGRNKQYECLNLLNQFEFSNKRRKIPSNKFPIENIQPTNGSKCRLPGQLAFNRKSMLVNQFLNIPF